MRIAIIISEFHPKIKQKMLSAALLEAKKQRIAVKKVVQVPGALEIPLALKKALQKKEIDAAATLGAVIQGETEHDRLVAFTCAEKILSLSLEFEKPVSICIAGPRISKKLAQKRASDYGKRSITTLKEMEKRLKNIG